MRWAVIATLAALPAVAETPDPLAGGALFGEFCAACHGETAEGGGLMAKVLTVAPPDLTRISDANDGVFPVFRVVRQIDGRDPLLAHGGEMPLFGEIFDFPHASIASEAGQPIITAQSIVDIVAWLKSVQK